MQSIEENLLKNFFPLQHSQKVSQADPTYIQNAEVFKLTESTTVRHYLGTSNSFCSLYHNQKMS